MVLPAPGSALRWFVVMHGTAKLPHAWYYMTCSTCYYNCMALHELLAVAGGWWFDMVSEAGTGH